MLRIVIFCLAIILCWGAVSAQCTPPPNEDCDTPTVFTNADLPYEVTAPLGCVNDEIDKPYFDVFYRFDCTVTGTYHIHLCNSSGDTYLRVYGDGCGWAEGFELAVADDECPGSPPNADPLLTIDLTAGQSYWLEVGPWRDVPPWAPPLNSPYTLSVTLGGPPPGDPAGASDGLRISQVGGLLELSWGESCEDGDTDYAIYQGQIAVPGEHTFVTCSTGSETTATIGIPPGDAYFLVVPNNEIVEGSYGMNDSGGQRPKGDPPCLPRLYTLCD